MSEMNVLSPNCSLEEEFNHRIRNLSSMQVLVLKRYAKEGVPTGMMLDAHQQGVVDCYKKIIAQ